jgi:hypothetical protein
MCEITQLMRDRPISTDAELALDPRGACYIPVNQFMTNQEFDPDSALDRVNTTPRSGYLYIEENYQPDLGEILVRAWRHVTHR